MEWLLKIFDVIKLPFRVVVCIMIISGILLFSPVGFLRKLELGYFLYKYGSYVGIVFLSALSLVVIHTTLWIFVKIKSRYQQYKWRKNLLDELHKLDHSEKAVLREFCLQGRNTIEAPIDNATVAGLKSKGIIYMVGELGHYTLAGMLAPFSISKEVLDVLTAGMIDMPTGKPSEKNKEWLLRSRPDFAKRIDEEKLLFDF